MIDPGNRVKVLAEALPYIQQFRGAVIVVKYGGNAMVDTALKHSFASDVVLLKAVGMHPVVVHGGGPRISACLEQRGLSGSFVHGIRVTDKQAMAVVVEVLDGINAEISRAIEQHRGSAESVKASRGMIRAKKFIHPDGSDVDFGFAGSVDSVAPVLGELVMADAKIPVLVPSGIGEDGLPYNINADSAAAGVAAALGARKLIFMTNTPGVLDEHGSLITNITAQRMTDLIDRGVVHTGMLPKVRYAFDAAHGGVAAVHIIDGRVQNALLLELLTDAGVGTLITKG